MDLPTQPSPSCCGNGRVGKNESLGSHIAEQLGIEYTSFSNREKWKRIFEASEETVSVMFIITNDWDAAEGWDE